MDRDREYGRRDLMDRAGDEIRSWFGDDEAETVATRIWREINEPNLLENILPTRDRAHLILTKAADHSVQDVQLRKL